MDKDPGSIAGSSGPDATGEEDDALIDACIAGDERAWGVLVDQYQRLVFSIARRHGLERDRADDVLQEVFAALVRALPNLRSKRTLPKWLMTTAYRITMQTIAAVIIEPQSSATRSPPCLAFNR